MRVLILAVLIGLAGCAAPGNRDRAAPFAAIVSFDPARFAGDWQEVAAIGRAPGARWQVGAAPFTIATTSLKLSNVPKPESRTTPPCGAAAFT